LSTDREKFREKVSGDLDFATATVTDRSRVISLGIVALCWAFIIGEIPKSGGLSVPVVNLLGPMLLALCSILCDWLQYLFAYLSSLNTLRSIERHPHANIEYNVTSLPYRMRSTMFNLKQALCFAGSIWFLITILLSLLSAVPPSPSVGVIDRSGANFVPVPTARYGVADVRGGPIPDGGPA
jgi:hypothetical protein